MRATLRNGVHRGMDISIRHRFTVSRVRVLESRQRCRDTVRCHIGFDVARALRPSEDGADRLVDGSGHRLVLELPVVTFRRQRREHADNVLPIEPVDGEVTNGRESRDSTSGPSHRRYVDDAHCALCACRVCAGCICERGSSGLGKWILATVDRLTVGESLIPRIGQRHDRVPAESMIPPYAVRVYDPLNP